MEQYGILMALTLMLNQVRPQILFLIHSINILQRNEKYKEKF